MTDPPALRLGAVAAVYLLWFVSWLVLGQEVFGPAYYNWAQALVATFAALASVWHHIPAASSVPASGRVVAAPVRH